MVKTNKFWIKTRVFLSFWFFIIIFTNIFSLLMYIFVEKSFVNNIQTNIELEFLNLQKVIDDSNSNIIQVPSEEIEKMDSEWIFYYIWYNDLSVIENYDLWFYMYWENIIFRWDYKWYNILIWKNISDLNKFKNTLLETNLLLNVFWLFITFVISYFVTNRVLRPLTKLSKYISDYELDEDKMFIINRYWSSEIWLITDSLNKFIKKVKDTLDSQKFFIQDASHELKTPLMQIQTNIELIEEDIKDEKNLKRLDNIKDSIDNINEILSNLWFLVRWQEKVVAKERIDIYEYIQNLVKKFEEDAKKKKIKFNIVEEEKLIIENSDYYLDRLFGNLISNSISYNEWNNTIDIIISWKSVIIKDEGIWIKEEDKKRIYNRFYRNRNSDIYNNMWSGLWLTIVKNIVDSFGWNISILSEEWKYTKITITF